MTGTLPSLNKYINAERSNRYIAADLKKQATEFVYWQVKTIPVLPAHADYVFTWYVKNQRTDPDNIAFAIKFIFDALVIAKKLPNDSMKEIGSLIHYFKLGEPRVEVEVIPTPT